MKTRNKTKQIRRGKSTDNTSNDNAAQIRNLPLQDEMFEEMSTDTTNNDSAAEKKTNLHLQGEMSDDEMSIVTSSNDTVENSKTSLAEWNI